ncbi:MAG: DedA family protein [Mangrovibacterium sp.]
MDNKPKKVFRTHPNLRRIILLFCLIALAVVIVSFTVGREIYGNSKHTLLSFAIVNLAGYLFFIVMPVELAFIYYLSTDLNLFLLNAVAISTALGSQLADYYIGRSFSTRIIDRLIGRQRYEQAEIEIRRYGNIAIFVFNFFPLSSPVILLAAGMLRHRIGDALLYSFAGLLLKYLLITLIF